MPRSIYFFWRHMLPWSEADLAIVLQSTLPRCLIRCWALASLSIATQSKWYIPSNRICVYDHSNHMHMFTDMSSLLQSMWKMVSWLFSRYWEYTPSSATTNSYYHGRNDSCNFVTLPSSSLCSGVHLGHSLLVHGRHVCRPSLGAQVRKWGWWWT